VDFTLVENELRSSNVKKAGGVEGEEGDKEGEIGHVVVLCLTPPTASNSDEDYGVDNSPLPPQKKKKKKTLGGGYHSLRSASMLRKPITDLKKNQFI
jgi:hypothetical protein